MKGNEGNDKKRKNDESAENKDENLNKIESLEALFENLDGNNPPPAKRQKISELQTSEIAISEVVNLRQFYSKLHRKIGKDKLDEYKNLAVEYISGNVKLDKTGSNRQSQDMMLAAIIENQSLEKAREFLSSFTPRLQESILFTTTSIIFEFGSIESLDLLLKLRSGALKFGTNYLDKKNILHQAAHLKDGGKVLSHVIKLISKEITRELAISEDKYGFKPFEAAASAEAFEMLCDFLTVEELINFSGRNNKRNILHEAVLLRDGIKPIEYVVRRIGLPAAKFLASQATYFNQIPLIVAVDSGDLEVFKVVSALTPNWHRNPQVLFRVLFEARDLSVSEYIKSHYGYVLGPNRVVNFVGVSADIVKEEEKKKEEVSEPNQQIAQEKKACLLRVPKYKAFSAVSSSSSVLQQEPLAQTAISSSSFSETLVQKSSSNQETGKSSQIKHNPEISESIFQKGNFDNQRLSRGK